jgi:hypothetical protein
MKKKTAENGLSTLPNIATIGQNGPEGNTMSEFIRLSSEALAQFNQNKVKKHYLQAIGTAILSMFKVMVEYLSGTELKVSGDPAELKKAFSFFASEYTPVMKGTNGLEKTPPYFTITRNPLSSFDGEYKSSKENNQNVRDRQRISSGLYRWNPTGATIVKNSDTNCSPEKTWIVKSASGKVLGTCRTLNADAWGFVASFKKQ